MDKPKNNRIIIKLNGNEQSYIENKKEPDEDSIETGSPEPGYLETAAGEAAEESFDWILPEINQNDIEEIKTVKPEKKKGHNFNQLIFNPGKKNKGFLKSILLASIFAVLLGTSFGIVMLKLVLTNHSNPNGTETIEAVAQPNTVENPAPAKNVYIFSPISLFVVQEGVYSSKETANNAADLAEQKGVASIVDVLNGKTYLFLGVAGSIEDAKKLGGLYQEKGVDFYAKSLETPEKELKNLSSDEKTFLKSVPVLFNGLSAASSSVLINQSLSKEAAANLEGIQKVTEKAAELKIDGEAIKQLRKELTAASEKMKSFQKDGENKQAASAQQHLLNSLAIISSI